MAERAAPRILIIGERFHPEAFAINELAQAWAARGYRVSVLTQVPSYPAGVVYEGYRNRLYQRERWGEITIHRVRTVTGYRESLLAKMANYVSFMLLGSLAALWIARDCDRVFAFQTGPLTSIFPAVVARRVLGKRLCIWSFDLWPETVFAFGFRRRWWLVWALERFVSLCYRSCDAVAVSCAGFLPSLRPRLRRSVPQQHIPNWAPPVEGPIEARRLGPPQRLQLTFTGNVGAVQNLERLLEALAQLAPASRQRVQLNIVGDGSRRQALEEQAQRLELGEAVVFWGRRPRQEMAGFYAGSDLLVISLVDAPVFNLTVPLKFQDYLSAGKPLLAPIKGEVARLLRCEQLGLVADPSDPAAIAASIERALAMSDDERDAIGQRARALAASRYRKDQVVDALGALLLR